MQYFQLSMCKQRAVYVCFCVCLYLCTFNLCLRVHWCAKIWGAWTLYARRCAVQGDESGNIVHHHQVRPASPDFADQASLQALYHPHPHLLSYFLQIAIVALLVGGDEFAIRNWSLKKATFKALSLQSGQSWDLPFWSLASRSHSTFYQHWDRRTIRGPRKLVW